MNKTVRVLQGLMVILVFGLIPATVGVVVWQLNSWSSAIGAVQRAALTTYMHADDEHREIYQQLLDCGNHTGVFQAKPASLLQDCKQVVSSGIDQAADPTGVMQAFENYDRALKAGATVPGPEWPTSAVLELGYAMSRELRGE